MEKEAFQARVAKLNQQKKFLLLVREIVPWEEFRGLLEKINDKPRKSRAGRKPYDLIFMFKLLILQQLYNLSDEELEYQVNDRISFMQFLGIGLENSIPDRTTVWLFKQQLIKYNLSEELFNRFGQYLKERGYQAKEGQILDATMIPVPKQRNSKEENQQIKQGQVPPEWNEKPHKLSQKDTDARWTKKRGISYYGYKDHINVDVEHRFIRRYEVSDASVHDSQVLGKLLDDDNDEDKLWADSAYRSQDIERILEWLKFDSQINERSYRNHPLTTRQKEQNRERSKTRAKVEHVFASMMQMGGKLLRSIGIERARVHLGLRNLTYNLKRFVFLESQTTG